MNLQNKMETDVKVFLYFYFYKTLSMCQNFSGYVKCALVYRGYEFSTSNIISQCVILLVASIFKTGPEVESENIWFIVQYGLTGSNLV